MPPCFIDDLPVFFRYHVDAVDINFHGREQRSQAIVQIVGDALALEKMGVKNTAGVVVYALKHDMIKEAEIL